MVDCSKDLVEMVAGVDERVYQMLGGLHLPLCRRNRVSREVARVARLVRRSGDSNP